MAGHRDSPRDRLPVARGESELPEAQKRQEQFIYSTISVLLGEVPIVGSVFNELRSYEAQRSLERRLHILKEELTEQMKEVGRESVNWAFLSTEDFQDFIRKAVEISLRTRDREKIRLVAQILRGAVVSFRQEDLSAAEEYLYLISDLTPQELNVARSVYKDMPIVSEDFESWTDAWNNWAEKTSVEIGLEVVDLRFALGRIVSSGLLDRVTTMRDGGEIVFTTPERGEVGLYRITPAFEKLMEFVRRKDRA